MVFHILNRGVARMPVFEKAGDFLALFEREASHCLLKVDDGLPLGDNRRAKET